MQIKKLVLSAAIALSFSVGTSNALSEECDGVCHYIHPYFSNFPFDIKVGACSIADCYPIPSHGHNFLMPYSIEPGPEPGDKSAFYMPELPLIEPDPASMDGEQGDAADNHSHSHSHAHQHHGALAGAGHHHGEVLEDQPVMFIDASTGDLYLFTPEGVEVVGRAGESPLDASRFDGIDLQSVHIVRHCDNSNTNCGNLQ